MPSDLSFEKWDELKQRVRESPGWPVRCSLGGLDESHEVLMGNAREVDTHLSAPLQDPAELLRLWDNNHRERLDAFLAETGRLLHNYLASATSLRDHTRRVREQHFSQGREQYDLQVRTVFDAGCAVVQDLRNFTLHRRLPIARGRLSWRREEGFESFVVILVRSDLLSWDRWRPEARTYLESLEDDVRVDEIVRQYTAAATSFHTWFGGVVAQANRDVLLDSNERIEELNAFQQRFAGSR